MVPAVLLRHSSSLEHDTGAHPEQAARIVVLERELSRRDWLGWEVRESPAAPRAALETVHPPEHVDRIEALCRRGGGMIDADTLVSEGSFAAAAHAAGGAIAVVDALLGEGARAAASMHRPPGHHAERARAMGFCLFNNVAVAARHAHDAHGVDRVMVVDWDVHHGNGTNDVFHDTDEVLFASVHEAPLYPGTGPASDTGSGAGEGFTVNVPLPGGSGDGAWVSVVEHALRPLGRAYAPQLLLVSAGYDAHVEDPLATCTVTDGGFAAMAASLRGLADELGVPMGLVLEGGYAVGALARSFAATLEVVAGEAGPEPPAVAVHPLAAAAAQRLADGRWPALAGRR